MTRSISGLPPGTSVTCFSLKRRSLRILLSGPCVCRALVVLLALFLEWLHCGLISTCHVFYFSVFFLNRKLNSVLYLGTGGVGSDSVELFWISEHSGTELSNIPKVKVIVTQLCLILGDPMDYSPPGSSVHEFLQARILEWVAMPSSRGSSQPRDRTQVFPMAGRFFTIWATQWGWICPLNANLSGFQAAQGFARVFLFCHPSLSTH